MDLNHYKVSSHLAWGFGFMALLLGVLALRQLQRVEPLTAQSAELLLQLQQATGIARIAEALAQQQVQAVAVFRLQPAAAGQPLALAA